MPNFSTSGFHDVESIKIEAVKELPSGAPSNPYRTQTVTIQMAGGGEHVITVFLAKGADGFPFRANRDGVRAQIRERERYRESLLGAIGTYTDSDSEGGLL